MISNTVQKRGATLEPLRLMIVCGEHGREMITTELCYYLVSLLGGQERAEFPEMPPPSQKIQAAVAAINTQVEFKVIPITNHESRKRVENGEICDRNPRGTALERNWGYAWSATVEFPGEEFPGKKAETEWEILAIKKEFQRWKPHAYIIVHSGEYGLYTPWTSRKDKPRNVEQMMKALNEMNQKWTKAVVGPRIGSFGEGAYTVAGSSIDWALSQGVIYSYVFEVSLRGVVYHTSHIDCFACF